MKLNLLPHEESSDVLVRKAIFRGSLGMVGAGLLAAFLIVFSRSGAEDARGEVESLRPQAELAYRTASRADEIMKEAVFLTTDLGFAEAVHRQNLKAIDLFQEVMNYLPGFFRLTSLTAAAKGDQDTLVVLEGVVHSYQEYADLMLALLRMTNVLNVQRSKPEIKESPVPSLDKEDQIGIRVPSGSPRLPSDPFKRMEAMIARASKPKELEPEPKLPSAAAAQEYHQYVKLVPGDSVVKVEMLVHQPFQVPNPRLTLAEVSKLRSRL